MEALKKFELPPSLRHLKHMTTDFGIIQHAKSDDPDPRFGYSIDDNARALIVCLKYGRLFNPADVAKIKQVYFDFLERAYVSDNGFHNFYSIEGQPLDKKGSEDSYGRTFWTLAEAAADDQDKQMQDKAREIFSRLEPKEHLIHAYIRTKSYILLAYCAIGDSDNIKTWADHLADLYRANSTDEWQWFERSLTYCNAVPVYALAKAASHLKNAEYTRIVREAYDWLNKVSRVDGVVAPIGQNGWYHHRSDKAIYDQQPVDAAKMVLAAVELFKLTKEDRYLQDAIEWMAWYDGANTQMKSLINPKTSGIYDALTPTGVNENQGAESIVTYLLAYLELSSIK